MGTDNIHHKTKARRAESHRRKMATRPQYKRFLIICEGEKTEPNYFRGLRKSLGLNPMNVVIDDIKHGLDPISLVEYALEEYRKDRDFDYVYCVFDRDKHTKYDAAIDKIRSTRLKGGHSIDAITSIPCFEFWILLHFTYTTRSFCAAGNDSNCALVMSDLKQHIPGYEKGAMDVFIGDDRLETAIKRAKQLEEFHKTSGTDNPSTKIYQLVEHLRELKQ